jgi:hypothetical protein
MVVGRQKLPMTAVRERPGDSGSDLLPDLNTRPDPGIRMVNRSRLRQALDTIDRAPPAVFLSAESRVQWTKGNLGDPAAVIFSPAGDASPRAGAA